jgi:hypothetical protein
VRWLVLLLILTSCQYRVPMPRFNECHKAIRYAVYTRFDCVTHTI